MPALITEPYLGQAAIWPQSGRAILAQYDARTIILYQAYRPSFAQVVGGAWQARRDNQRSPYEYRGSRSTRTPRDDGLSEEPS